MSTGCACCHSDAGVLFSEPGILEGSRRRGGVEAKGSLLSLTFTRGGVDQIYEMCLVFVPIARLDERFLSMPILYFFQTYP